MTAFQNSFDTVWNMCGHKTICIDPNVHPVKHARFNVPVESKKKIERKLLEMASLNVIAPVTMPTKKISLTYTHKPDSSLCTWLDPCNLNKAIRCEYYKVHWLNGTTTFSKLDMKIGFWSIISMKPADTWSHLTHARVGMIYYECHSD